MIKFSFVYIVVICARAEFPHSEIFTMDVNVHKSEVDRTP